MNSIVKRIDQGELIEILSHLRRRGVRVWPEDETLRYEAPQGALTTHDLQRLRVHKSALLDLLAQTVAPKRTEPQVRAEARARWMPLTSTQLAHWRHYALEHRSSLRVVASALRLQGALSMDRLQEALSLVIQRHDALRTRIELREGIPMQIVSETPHAAEIELTQLTSVPKPFRQFEIQRHIERLVLEPVDVTTGPMWRVQLLRFEARDHVLLIALEHLISDGTSLNIMIRDLLAAYRCLSTGDPAALPAMPLQYSEYVAGQSAQPSSLERSRQRWRDRLQGCPPARFNDRTATHGANRFWWGAVPIRIDRELKSALAAWAREQRTTLIMTAFTVFVALLLRENAGAAERIIQYQTNGRTSAKLANTIGYFTSALYLRVGLHQSDTFGDLIQRVTEEYCLALECSDAGDLAAHQPNGEVVQSVVFNWSPLGTRIEGAQALQEQIGLGCEPIRFAYPLLSNLGISGEPALQFREAQDEVLGDVYFPLDRFQHAAIERFAGNYLVMLRALIDSPRALISEVPIVP